MPRVLIANIDNENLMADARARTPDYCLELCGIAARMAWFAEAGDIVILPQLPSPRFQDYLDDMMGRAPGSVSYVMPDWNATPISTLGWRELQHLGVREKVQHLMRGRSDWSLFPYCLERSAVLFGEALRLDLERQVPAFMRQGGAELMNDKRVFRSLAAGRGVALAEGVVSASETELVQAIESLIAKTGAVIVKQDRHGGGHGNLIVSRAHSIAGLGASDVIVAADDASIARAAADVWRRLAYAEAAPLVVEAYYSAVAVVTAEFKIDPRENAVAFLSCGEVRQAPIIKGIVMPWSLPPCLAGAFIAGATELARLSCDLGYDGLINIDGIATIDGRIIYNEFNGRVGGCSHIDHIMRKVAGPSYGDQYAVASHSSHSAVAMDEVLDTLRHRRMGFDAESGRGVIMTGEGAAGSGYLEYLSIGSTHEDAMRVEAEFERLLNPAAKERWPAGIEHLERILSHLPEIPSDSAKVDEESASTTSQGSARKA